MEKLISESISAIRENISFLTSKEQFIIIEILNKYEINTSIYEICDDFIPYHDNIVNRTIKAMDSKIRTTLDIGYKGKRYRNLELIEKKLDKKRHKYLNMKTPKNNLKNRRFFIFFDKYLLFKMRKIDKLMDKEINSFNLLRDDIPNWIFNAYEQCNTLLRNQTVPSPILEKQKQILINELINTPQIQKQIQLCNQ